MKKVLVGLLLTISLISYGTTKIQKDFERKLENLKSEKGNKSGKLYEDFGIFIDDGILLDVLTDGHKKMTYKINSAKVEGDTAVINLDMKSPNLSYYFPEFIKKVYELIFADPENIKEDDEEFVNNFFKEKLNLKDLKYSKKNINVYLRKEGNDWLVDEEESKNDDFNEMITLGLLKLDDGLIWGFPENDEE